MRRLPLALLVIIFVQAKAQSVSTTMGARANALGYSSATLHDVWGMFNNVAGIAGVENTEASFTYDLRPALPGANRAAAVAAVPVKVGVVGSGVYRFGDDVYSEQLITLGYSNRFGIASLGTRISYVQYRAEGFGSKGVLSVSAGGIAALTKQFSVGAYITNINQPSISDSEKLPTKLATGVSFTPTDKILVTSEIEKDLEYDPTWKIGLEYTFLKKFIARTGYNLYPNAAFFGLGLKARKLKIDYALQYHTLLNLSHQASVSFQFVPK